ncbi:MAG: hypothetical protein ACYSTJ_09500 [Planctomycetota bacterium]|jgi:hypothetical protein
MYSLGGAIYCDGSSPTIENCVVGNNFSNDWGGGMYCYNGDPVVSGCRFVDNKANSVGGGVYNNTSSALVHNCIFSGNLAAYGGGIYNLDTSPTIVNCTFNGNQATGYGGAMRNNRSNVELVNCILWADTASDGNEMANSSSTVLISYSDVEDCNGSGPSWNMLLGSDGGGNIDTDPCFADTGYWDVNGWVDGDYHLQSEAGRWDPNSISWVVDAVTSSCVDAGDPNSDWTLELWPHGKRINMGAYGGVAEASMSLSSLGNVADLNSDGIVNMVDYSVFAQQWRAEDVLLAEDFSHNRFVNTEDLRILCQNRLWQGP